MHIRISVIDSNLLNHVEKRWEGKDNYTEIKGEHAAFQCQPKLFFRSNPVLQQFPDGSHSLGFLYFFL